MSEIIEQCKNKDCYKHMPEAHGGSCIVSGKNKCQDLIHNKTCWTEDDLERLKAVLNNY